MSDELPDSLVAPRVKAEEPKTLNGDVISPVAKKGKYRGGGSKPGERRGGRAVGTRNKLTLQNLERAYQSPLGMTPLDVLFEGMARNREMALALAKDVGTKEFKLEEYLKVDAATRAYAADAAPFCHSRMSPKRPDGDLPNFDLESLTDAQLNILILRLGSGDRTGTG
jgi:hypothetical protein